MIESLTIRPLTPERWPDLETLFGPDGAEGGCWCMWWRFSPKVGKANQGEGNRMALRQRVEEGRATGLLAYQEDEPVGWVSIAPREEYERVRTSQTWRPIDSVPVWAIVCFFVRVDRGQAIVFVFILALIITYLVLSAQFESFVSPVVIMLTVPMGLLGACVGMLITGNSLNIYSQIGLVMLIGLAAKNAILIVEFANQLRDRGVPFEDAVFQASRLRLRPIMMTGLSTAIGAVPLLMASGAGAGSRISLGAVIFFGASAACILTMFVVPFGYFYLSRSQKSPKYTEHKLQKMETDIIDKLSEA